MANQRLSSSTGQQASPFRNRAFENLRPYNVSSTRKHNYISSPEIAKEMFLKHDLNFSCRPIPDGARAGDHHKYSILWLPVCPKWRDLRKLATLQLFKAQKLDASQGLRHRKVRELVEFARPCSENGLPVDINKAAFTTVFNLLSNTIFSMNLASFGSSDLQEFTDLVSKNMELAGKPNVSDFFPVLRRLDLQGVLKRRRVYLMKIKEIVGKIIDARLENPGDFKDDVLGTLKMSTYTTRCTVKIVHRMLFIIEM